ncbi:MAG: hypothetical protein LBT26_10375, partial [Clostridiales Family XIII bacterium]|nr:hypothetical protein [Clostridiales Family XIII bacterium]
IQGKFNKRKTAKNIANTSSSCLQSQYSRIATKMEVNMDKSYGNERFLQRNCNKNAKKCTKNPICPLFIPAPPPGVGTGGPHVVASNAKQSSAQYGLLRRFTPRNDTGYARPPAT